MKRALLHLVLVALAVTAAAAGNFAYSTVYIFTTPFNHDHGFVAPSLGCTGNTPNSGDGTSDYCPLINNVIPNVDGVLMYVTWTQGTGFIGTDAGFEVTTEPISNPPPAAQYTFTNLDTYVFQPLTSLTCASGLGRSHPCWYAVIVSPRIDGNANTNAPPYIYDQGAGSWADMVCPAWQAGHLYYTSQCAKFAGTYYQLTTAPSCVPTGAVGPTADGCTWAASAHAAPVDVATCAQNEGVNLPADTTTNILQSNCGTGTQQCTDTEMQTGVPFTWETPMDTALRNAYNALLAHESTQTWAAQGMYARVGLSSGGASTIKCETQIAAAITAGNNTTLENLWVSWDGNLNTALIATQRAYGFPKYWDMPFACVNTTCSNQMAVIGAQLGAGMGTQGLEASDVTHYYNGGIPGANNQVGNMLTYGASAPMFHTQLISESTVDNSGNGSMTQLFPFIAQFRGHAPLFVEVYGEDNLCAWWSGFTDAICTAGNAPFLPYQQMEQYLAIGPPPPVGGGLARGK